MAQQTVTLQPGESKSVSFEAIPHEARTFQVSVDGLSGTFVAQKGIHLKDLTINPQRVNPGILVNVSCTVVNDSSIARSYTATLRVEEVDLTLTKDVLLQPGESKVVSFGITPFETGTYHVSIDGLSGTVECTAAPMADILVQKLSITSQVRVGETVSIEVTVMNQGTGTGTKIISCSIQPGDKYFEQTVKLMPGESDLVKFIFTPTNVGTYNVQVNSRSGSFQAISSTPEIQGPNIVIHSIGGIPFSKIGKYPPYYFGEGMAPEINYGILTQQRVISAPTGETIEFTSDKSSQVTIWLAYAPGAGSYPLTPPAVGNYGMDVNVRAGVRNSIFVPCTPLPLFRHGGRYSAGIYNISGGITGLGNPPFWFMVWPIYLNKDYVW